MQPIGRYVYWVFIGVFCLGSIAIFSPGSMGNDSLTQWYQLNGILPLDDWHPPMIVHLWSVLNQFTEGPLGLLIFQQVLYWTGLGLIINQITNTDNDLLKLVVVALVGFYPVIWFSMASVWKDALMLSSLLFSVGLFLSIRNQIKSGSKWAWITLFFVWVTLVLSNGIRHNAVFAVAPLIFMMTYDILKLKTHLRKVLIGVFALFSVVVVSNQINRIGVQVHYPYLINQVVFWNLAGLSIEGDEMLIPDQAFVDPELAKIEVLEKYYNDASNNQIVFSSGIINPAIWEDEHLGKAFFMEGVSQILKHPKAYVNMRMRFLKHFSGIGRWMPYMAYIFETKYWKGDENLKLKMYPMQNPSLLSLLEDKVASRMSHFGLFIVLPYLAVLLLALVLLLFNYEQDLKVILVGLTCSSLMYWLPYLILAPSNDFRYHNWVIDVAMILVVTGTVNFLLGRASKKDKRYIINKSERTSTLDLD